MRAQSINLPPILPKHPIQIHLIPQNLPTPLSLKSVLPPIPPTTPHHEKVINPGFKATGNSK